MAKVIKYYCATTLKQHRFTQVKTRMAATTVAAAATIMAAAAVTL